MKHIRILKETTDHWKFAPTGSVIAMTNDEDADSVIKNGEGELVASRDRWGNLLGRLDNIEQRQQKEAQRLLELNLQVQRLAQECGCKLQDMTKIRKLLDQ